MQRCRRARWSARALTRTTDEHVEDVLVNVAHALSLRALHRMSASRVGRAAAHGGGADGALLGSSAACSSTSPGGERASSLDWSSLAPLALEGIPREIRERLATSTC